MNGPLLDEPSVPVSPPSQPSLPRTHGRFELVGSVLGRTNCGGIFAVVREISAEVRRSGKSYWSFEQYERFFAAAMTPDRKWAIILTPIVKLRARYNKARAAQLSAWQFAQQEQRLREAYDQAEARHRATSAELEARSRSRGYAALVAENETKERARRDARENVAQERPARPGGRVTRAPAASKRPGVVAPFGERNDEHEYLPPDPF